MIAIASRGWTDHVGEVPDVLAMSPLPGGGFLAGRRDGHLRWIAADGKLDPRDVDLGLGPITWLQDQVDYALVVADGGIAAVGTRCCDVLVKVPRTTFVHNATLGPGADELTLLDKSEIEVVARDGTSRRSLALPSATTDASFDRGGKHALFWAASDLTSIDLQTMKTTPVAHDLHGDLAASEDRQTFAYLDEARAIHLVHADGSAIATIHPSIYAAGVILSASGDRLAAITEHAIAVYDRDGRELRRFTSELTSQGAAMIDGDDVWTASRDGKLRRYHAGVLVASLPVHVADITDVYLSGRLLGSLGSDYVLQLTRADAMQFHPAAPPCDRTSTWAFSEVVLSSCKDGRALAYIGTHQLGALVGISDDTPTVTHDAATGFTGVASDSISVFGPDATLRAVSTKLKANDVSFEDTAHLLVVERGPTGALWRWTFGTDTWQRLLDTKRALAVAWTPYGTYLSYDDGHVSVLDTRRGRRARAAAD